jgi:hypothetical protein
MIGLLFFVLTVLASPLPRYDNRGREFKTRRLAPLPSIETEVAGVDSEKALTADD